MNPQQHSNSNGNGAPHGAPAVRQQRTKVTFEVDTPEPVQLDGWPPQHAVAGNWGDQFMYSLRPDHIMFVEPEVHEQIKAQQGAPGDWFTITKRKQGRRNVWLVEPGNTTLQPAANYTTQPADYNSMQSRPRPAAPAPAPTARGPQEHIPRSSFPPPIPDAEVEKASAVAAAAERERTPAKALLMAAALKAAIDATQQAAEYADAIGANYRPSSEAIDKLAITIYIEVNSGGGRKR